MDTIDVAIVGAGPTGAFAANLCGLADNLIWKLAQVKRLGTDEALLALLLAHPTVIVRPDRIIYGVRA